MKRMLKTYFAFTNRIYRLLVLILLPLLAVLSTVIAGIIDSELMSLVMVIYYVFFMFIEPFSDYWFLGGFYSKKKGALEFMQSSNRFSGVIRDVVVVDMVRRVLVNAILFLVMVLAGIISEINPKGYALLAFFPFLEIFFGELIVFIARHFDLWNHYYVVILIGYMLVLTLIVNSVIFGQKLLGIMCVVMALLAIVMAVVTVAYTNKKVRDSYYDK